MGISTRGQEGNFQLIFGLSEMNALIGLLWSMAIRSDLSNLFR